MGACGNMIKPYADKITHIYKPSYKGRTKHFVAFATEKDCWKQIIEDERYGLEREYAPKKKDLVRAGWHVVKYKLIEVLDEN